MNKKRIFGLLAAMCVCAGLIGCSGDPGASNVSPGAGASNSPVQSGESTAYSGSTAPSGTMASGETTGPDQTAKPGETTRAGQTAKPGETTRAGQTTKPGQTTAKTQGGGTASGDLKTASGITIKAGTKKMEEGLDFGGATFTQTHVGAVSASFTRQIKAFESKFNCHIQLVSLGWESYIEQIAAKKSTGESYNILGIHSASQHPIAAKSDLLEPLQNAFTTADVYQADSGSYEGLDMA